jgi:anti-sigma regulatory factor (Ser/Thr protein kinase)
MDQEPGVMVSLRLACDEQAPGAVREALAELSDGDPLFGDVMLVASELVTNAVRHSDCLGEDQLDVLVLQDTGHLLISVRDPGTSGRTARVTGPTDDAFGGLGLLIVQQLASEWGEERSDGYRVWARVASPQAG